MILRVIQIIDGKWNYDHKDEVKIGDKIKFLCNGRGRGGHYSVFAIVDKINKKTIKCTEAGKSYLPGTPWIVNKEAGSEIFIDRS